MKVQVAFTLAGFTGSLQHMLDIDDKDGYDVNKMKDLINVELHKEMTTQQVPIEPPRVDKILYSIQLENIPNLAY